MIAAKKEDDYINNFEIRENRKKFIDISLSPSHSFVTSALTLQKTVESKIHSNRLEQSSMKLGMFHHPKLLVDVY